MRSVHGRCLYRERESVVSLEVVTSLDGYIKSRYPLANLGYKNTILTPSLFLNIFHFKNDEVYDRENLFFPYPKIKITNGYIKRIKEKVKFIVLILRKVIFSKYYFSNFILGLKV